MKNKIIRRALLKRLYKSGRTGDSNHRDDLLRSVSKGQ